MYYVVLDTIRLRIFDIYRMRQENNQYIQIGDMLHLFILGFSVIEDICYFVKYVCMFIDKSLFDPVFIVHIYYI